MTTFGVQRGGVAAALRKKEAQSRQDVAWISLRNLTKASVSKLQGDQHQVRFEELEEQERRRSKTHPPSSFFASEVYFAFGGRFEEGFSTTSVAPGGLSAWARFLKLAWEPRAL